VSAFSPSSQLLECVVDRINVGVFMVDIDLEIQFWNGFMATHSGIRADEVLGRKLFDCFPQLPQRWLEKKINSVFMLKNFAFSSWQQRPYLFQFRHNRPVTGDMEFMRQDLTLIPIKRDSGEVDHVCIILLDVTDTAIYHALHQSAMQKLENASRIDGLTQLLNRSHWQSRLTEEFNRATRYQQPLSLILFDLDHFKSINDSHGHLGGDAVLVEVAAIVKKSLRDSDIAGRYGGEEFGLILPGTPATEAMRTAERLRTTLQEQPILFEGTPIAVTASLGIGALDATIADENGLIAAADAALYSAKRSGRNRAVLHEERQSA
jgi:diguanylate cyclase